jgi:hypothetical protein
MKQSTNIVVILLVIIVLVVGNIISQSVVLNAILVWYFNVLLTGLLVWLSWLYVRNYKIRKNVENQLRSWDRSILTPSKVHAYTYWPQWAKDELNNYDSWYNNVDRNYQLKKKKVLHLLSHKPKTAQKDGLPILAEIVETLQKITQASQDTLPSKIALYEGNAVNELVKRQNLADELKSLIQGYQKAGFRLEKQITEVNTHLEKLQQWKTRVNMRAPWNPDLFKRGYDFAMQIEATLKDLETRVSHLVSNHTMVKNQVGKEVERLDNLLRQGKSTARKQLSELAHLCPESVYKNYQKQFNELDTTIATVKNQLDTAYKENDLKVQKFHAAFKLYNEGVAKISEIEQLYVNISTRLSLQKTARQEYSKYEKNAKTAVFLALMKCKQKRVTKTSKRKCTIAKIVYNYANTLWEKSDKKLLDWHKICGLYLKAAKIANYAYEQAEADIREARRKATKNRRRQSYSSSRR